MTLFESAPQQPVRRVARKRARRAMVASSLSTIVAISVVFGAVWVIQHPQPIIDQVTVWQYEPPPEVETHVTRLALTDHGRFLYYASQPRVESSTSFSQSCPADKGEEGFGILGCYLPSDKTIFLYDVTDKRLDGTEEVTAAHEMLHAAWDRMGDEERTRLGGLLEAEAEKRNDNPLFAERMSIYARIEPGERANELHSIIGTEMKTISPELEDYYASYFTDRTIVTALHSSANAVFVQLNEETDELISEMDALRTGIEADYLSYTNGYEQFSRDVQEFNRRNQATTSEELRALEQERNELLARQARLDELYASISSRSDEFYVMMDKLESLNAMNADLQRGLNIGGAVTTESAE